MIVEKVSKYRDYVSHLRLYFHKPEMNSYVGGWAIEWGEMLIDLNREIQGILDRGYGILEVEITKTEPTTGTLFIADITYWNHP
jgi:hypothetical protein